MSHPRSITRGLFPFVGLLLLGSMPVLAQTNQSVNAFLQFNFANPGARSLALGGAFLGLADDATAAVSNPAGLINLSKPEISAEGRRWNYRTNYLDAGGPPTTPYEPTGPAISPAPFSYKRSDDTVNGLSFASLVFPFKNWALAVYRHEQAHFETNISTGIPNLGVFPSVDQKGNVYYPYFYLKPIDGRISLKITNIGGSVAFRLGETLSLGASVAASQLKQDTTDTLYDLNFDANGHPTGRGAVSLKDASTGDQTKVTYTVGLLWKPIRLVSLGGVYRHGPKFDLGLNVTHPDGTSFDGYPCKDCAKLRVPDVYGLGVSLHPTDFFTVSIDYDRVKYSQVSSNFTVIYFPANSPNFASGYQASDADEFHFGLQYAIPLGGSALALRAGLWRDPAHAVRFIAPTTFDSQSVIAAATFTGGESETHYSGGLGVVLGQHVQLDLGYDSARSVRTGSASLVVRF